MIANQLSSRPLCCTTLPPCGQFENCNCFRFYPNSYTCIAWGHAHSLCKHTFTSDLLLFLLPGEEKWLITATGVTDCYYNVTELPAGGAFRFRVACVNKAGQGPYSNCSPRVSLDQSGNGSNPQHLFMSLF